MTNNLVSWEQSNKLIYCPLKERHIELLKVPHLEMICLGCSLGNILLDLPYLGTIYIKVFIIILCIAIQLILVCL